MDRAARKVSMVLDTLVERSVHENPHLAPMQVWYVQLDYLKHGSDVWNGS